MNNSQVTETEVKIYDVAVQADAVALVGKYLAAGVEVSTNWHFGPDATGQNRPIGCDLLKNGEVVASFVGVGGVVGNIPEGFVALYEKAKAEGLGSIQVKKAAAKKASGVTNTSGTSNRGRLNQAQMDEIAEMSRQGMTAQEISLKTGRSEKSVQKYMVVDNALPVAAMAEGLEEEVVIL